MLYQKVIENCNANNLSEFAGAVQWEYNEEKNIGRVWVQSSGKGDAAFVIILNEFGTGIKGDDQTYASKHHYKINMSKKGELGWAFPTKDGQFKWTHGIRSKKMFYEAYLDMVRQFGDVINFEIKGSIGKLYERTD